MKGAMLQIESTLQFVDITHNVDPQDIMGAAFVLRQALPYFPPRTVHLAVVDPGVGGENHPIAARINNAFFVGRDNGLLALLLDGKKPDEMVVLDKPEFWRTETLSKTFHGRDLFAPVAAHIASGCSLENIGTLKNELTRLHWAHPLTDDEGIEGFVIHIDHFGNCITNISAEHLSDYLGSRNSKCYVGSAIVKGIYPTYSSVADAEPVALVGSSGFLEIAVNGGNASELFTINKGSQVSLVFGDVDREISPNVTSDLTTN